MFYQLNNLAFLPLLMELFVEQTVLSICAKAKGTKPAENKYWFI